MAKPVVAVVAVVLLVVVVSAAGDAHYVNGGHSETVSVLNAQNPGVQLVPSALFWSSPAIKTEILAKAFGISSEETEAIKKAFQPAA